MNKPSSNYRFRVVSENGDGVGFAVRLTQLGYPTKVWIRNQDAKSIGDGLVDKVGDIDDLIREALDDDVFIFDTTGNGAIADALVDWGFPVIGGSMLMDRLERDREYGYEVMEKCGVSIPETLDFNNFDDAIKVVEDNPDVRWVFKPSKQLGDLSASHVSYDAEDLIAMLKSIEKDVDIKSPRFELQAFEKGVALSTELWFQHGELIDPLCNHTLERKQLMNNDIGPSGGCVGNVIWFCDGCAVCEVTKQLVSWCRDNRYHGPLDLNTIVTKDAIYGLEFTPRFGYDAAPTLLWELINNDLGQFLGDLANARLRDIDIVNDVFAAGLEITMPPWPTERHLAEENVPIRGLPKNWEKNTYLFNIKQNAEGTLVSAGAWGILLTLTHKASTIAGALREPLQRADGLKIKNKQYRTDLAACFNEDMNGLGTSVHKRLGRSLSS